MKPAYIVDRLSEGLYCSCGTRLWPDCDVSSVSIMEEFDRHLSGGDHQGDAR